MLKGLFQEQRQLPTDRSWRMRTETVDTYQNTNTEAGSVTLTQYSILPLFGGVLYVVFFSRSMSA